VPQPPADTVCAAAETDVVDAPTPQIIGYARRLIRRRYHASAQDTDDLVGQALLDFVEAGRGGRPCRDGLFLVIAHRRACDFWRRHRTELPLEAAAAVAYALDDSRLDERILRRRLRQAILAGSRLDKRRILGITNEILSGASFADACRATGVPRGSQGRYRQALRGLLAVELGLCPGSSRRIGYVTS
jgi:DNA-directed RNA polymerase specialized sigma24 family protein